MDRSQRVEQAERLDIVVKGRRAEVSDRFREHVKEKLSRLERLDPKAFRVDVEVCHESNPRLADSCERIELTLHSRGPVVRAEAAAQDPYGALDIATAKLEERLRRAADRRRTRHQQHHGYAGVARAAAAAAVEPLPESVASDRVVATAVAQAGVAEEALEAAEVAEAEFAVAENGAAADGDVLMAAGPLVVREKSHDATPMTLDEALHRMELVGHDFFLFCDADSGLPSVVYRRRGYTYGVLRLRASEKAAP